jgi:hypothetical protein
MGLFSSPTTCLSNRAKIIREAFFVGLVTARKTDIIARFVFALPALFFHPILFHKRLRKPKDTPSICPSQHTLVSC